ncbi:MAG: lysophospholipid acyltransferase family protein [Bacteroidales bacterium]|nr:lysophospholipid acyltransferase family protein [Bacteroidales bacterium]
MRGNSHIIVSRSDLQKGLKLKGFFGGLIARFLMSVFQINKLNRAYQKTYDKDAIQFTENVINHNCNDVFVHEKDLKDIPDSGPVVFLFNHPYGGLDALAIVNTLLKIRPDTKFIANFLLTKIEPMAPYLFQVNPFEDRKQVFSSLGGLKEMYKYIQQGNAVCILPAGEVSTKYNGSNVVEDREWQSNIMKFVRSTDAHVVSGYISGENSKLFHLMGKINPALRTAMLPRELLNKKNLSIYIRFSGHSANKTIKKLDDNKLLSKIFKAKTYMLKDDCLFSHHHKLDAQNYKEIIEHTAVSLQIAEINSLKQNNLLFQTDNYLCFFASSKEIPNIFRELSRLRELTFREIGEGTGKECDSDKYDDYYKHLFLWDETENCLVGAYRIGMGEEILKQNGVDGFYINSLFSLQENFKPYLQKSLEMGRSFIVPSYQRKALPLFLLWKGIYHVTQKYPYYKYLIGPASISNIYSDNSKILIIEYLKQKHSWPELNDMVQSKTPFNYQISEHHQVLIDSFGEDISSMDKLIKDIDLNHMGVPVLIKKYLSLGGRILDFNVDPDFNYSVDGFVVLDIDVVSEEVIKSYNK